MKVCFALGISPLGPYQYKMIASTFVFDTSKIKKELGLTIDDKTVEITKFEEKMAKFKPSDEVKEKFQEEINKLKVLEQGSPEYAITRNHIEWMTNIPWGVYTPETLDIKHTRKVLDEDHDAIVDVKERIVEFVAVGSKRGEVNGSIILFVGPPGVGKTSVGKSIARALNRPFYRFSVDQQSRGRSVGSTARSTRSGTEQ